mgnify:CR=1 FL=1
MSTGASLPISRPQTTARVDGIKLALKQAKNKAESAAAVTSQPPLDADSVDVHLGALVDANLVVADPELAGKVDAKVVTTDWGSVSEGSDLRISGTLRLLTGASDRRSPSACPCVRR